MKKNFFNNLLTSLILAGAIILMTGLFYIVIVAGIPYQDPPLELQIQYAVNMGIGETLSELGFVIMLAGGVLKLLISVIRKLSAGRNKQR
ncbi:MAG: hypothetical protein K5686_02755 [Lachnospiraceae bacterium]|nr:hypothetical protein [Lachnospiraceae bacterium]